MRTLRFVLVALFLSPCVVRADDAPPNPTDVNKAVERGLPFLEKGGVAWMQERKCVSCHTVAFTLWSHNEARRHGVAVDNKKLDEWTKWSLDFSRSKGADGGGLDTMSQLVLSRDPARQAAQYGDYETLWENLIARQKDDGSWPVEGQLTCPPEASTRWALLALASRDDDGRPSAAPELAARDQKIDENAPKSREKALAWLKKTAPAPGTESLLLRMLVERKYGDADRAADLLKELLGRQYADGGWGFMKDAKGSDAFATGQVLYALGVAGSGGDDPTVRRACQYLLQTQRSDGAWTVPTSAIHSIDGVKPDRLARTDTVNTYWGSAWAVIGLARTLPIAAAEKDVK